MIALVCLAAAAQAADLLTFAPAVARYGSAMESNPVMAFAYDAGGIWGAAAMKGTAFLLATLAVYAIAGAGGPQWVSTAILLTMALVGFIGMATNLWALSL